MRGPHSEGVQPSLRSERKSAPSQEGPVQPNIKTAKNGQLFKTTKENPSFAIHSRGPSSRIALKGKMCGGRGFALVGLLVPHTVTKGVNEQGLAHRLHALYCECSGL